LVPQAAVPALEFANKYAVQPFEKMARKGVEMGRDLGAGYVQGASGGASGLSPIPRQTPLTKEQSATQNPITTGIAEGIGGTIGGVVADPRMWPMMGEGAVAPVLKKIMSGGFATMMTGNT